MSETRVRRRLTEAEGYLELGLLDQAEQCVEAAGRSGLLPLECALLRGDLERERARYAEGVVHYQQALTLEPGGIRATVGLGWCLKRVGQVEEAARHYEEALRHHPQEALLHYNLACYRSLLGQAEEALAALNRALKLDGEFRALAKEESDFDPIRSLPSFQERISG